MLYSGISFSIDHGELLGVVGKSGSGKTVAKSLAIMGLLDRDLCRLRGEINLKSRTYLELSPREFPDVPRNKVAMIYQDPFASLHPMYRVGRQIADAVKVHSNVGRRASFEKAVELLDRVGVPNAARRAHDYPHQFSGGMRQRAMIAMALAHEPIMLIADEPTTALDVTVQAKILDLLDELLPARTEDGSAARDPRSRGRRGCRRRRARDVRRRGDGARLQAERDQQSAASLRAWGLFRRAALGPSQDGRPGADPGLAAVAAEPRLRDAHFTPAVSVRDAAMSEGGPS